MAIMSLWPDAHSKKWRRSRRPSDAGVAVRPPHAVDATREEDVIHLFDAAMADDENGGPADLVTHNVGLNQKIDFRQTDASTFEDFWRLNTLSGFLVGREAARRFAPLGRGSVFLPAPRDRFAACRASPISPRARRGCA